MLFIVLNLLPGPREIKRTLVQTNKAVEKSPIITKETLPTEREDGPNFTENSDQEKLQARDERKKSNNVALLKRLIEDDNYLSVCENLREKSAYNVGADKAEVDFDSLFEERNNNDPILDTFRYPLIQVFKDESLAMLMGEVLKPELVKAQEKERSSMLEKMNFYAKATATVIRLRSRKSEFEQLADRSEHLRVFAMVSQLKPDLAFDSSYLESCNSLQDSIMNNDEKIDIRKEREQIISMIKRNGLKPSDLNFNPESFTKYEVKLSKDGLTFSLDSDDDEVN